MSMTLGYFVCVAMAVDLYVMDERVSSNARISFSEDGTVSVDGFPDITNMEKEAARASKDVDGDVVISDFLHGGGARAWGELRQEDKSHSLSWYIPGSLGEEGRLPPILVGRAICVQEGMAA